MYIATIMITNQLFQLSVHVYSIYVLTVCEHGEPRDQVQRARLAALFYKWWPIACGPGFGTGSGHVTVHSHCAYLAYHLLWCLYVYYSTSTTLGGFQNTIIVLWFCQQGGACWRRPCASWVDWSIESDMDVRAVSLIQARERPKAEGRGPLEGRNQRYLPWHPCLIVFHTATHAGQHKWKPERSPQQNVQVQVHLQRTRSMLAAQTKPLYCTNLHKSNLKYIN